MFVALLKITLMLFFVISLDSFGAQVVLSEGVLKSYLKEGVPHWDQVALKKREAEAGRSLFSDKYTTGIFAESEIAESDDPRESVWSKQHSIGVRQALPWGISGSLGYVHRYEKFGPFIPNFANQETYVPVLFMNLEFDLWKNIFGSLDRAQRNYLDSLVRQSSLWKKLNEKKIYNQLRMLYWRIVIQDQRIKIYNDLVKTAKIGYQNMKSRQKDSVADLGSVAKMAANLSGAEANYRRAKIDRNFLERELKIVIPSLQKFDVKARDSYRGVRKAVSEAVKCSKRMGRLVKVPYHYTEFDELITMIDEASQWKIKELDTHASPDIKLSLEGRSFGLDPDQSTAMEQPMGLEKTAYTATLGVTVPIGSPYSTERQNLANERTRTSIRKTEISAEYAATHSNVRNNFGPLAEAVDLYHKSIKDQEEAFKYTQRKFKQGRISVFDFIGSQDTLLNSRLQVAGLEERVIIEMLKYYSTFNQAPCTFNRN